MEKDIMYNDYLTDSIRVKKIDLLLKDLKFTDFEKKDLFIQYAKSFKTITSHENDDVNVIDALDDLIWISENCDTTNSSQTILYLGCVLQINRILSKNDAFELALKFTKNGLDLIERRKLFSYMWINEFYNDYGVNLSYLQRYEESIKTLEKALVYTDKEDYSTKSSIEHNITLNLYYLGKIEKSLDHQKLSCAYMDKITNFEKYPDLLITYASSVSLLAYIYYQTKHFDEAKKSGLKARLAYEKAGEYDSGSYPYLFALINIAIKNKNQEEIKNTLQEIKTIVKKVKTNKYLFYNLLSKSYASIKDTALEKKYLQEAYNIYQLENSKIISNLQGFNSKLQSQKIKFLKSKQDLQELNYKKSNQLFFVFIGLLFIVIIALIYFSRVKRRLLESKNVIASTEIQKNEYKAQLVEKEIKEKQELVSRLASHIKLKQETETAFLKKIKELKRNKNNNIEAVISELQVKMMNLLQIDQGFQYGQEVDEINQDKKETLKHKHPELSDKEVQFCMYLLLNLSTKEISSLTNQSPGAVRVYKNNIKNKLIKDNEIDLTSYLKQINEPNGY
ncbi:MAG: hypothetical protein V4622_07945 [Bacteroidota bacterium]